MRWVCPCRAGLLALAVALAGGPPSAIAFQFDVTTLSDSGPGSLRQALLDAALLPGDDEIVVQADLGTLHPSSELAWSAIAGPNSVTISGNGLTVDFGGASRGFVDENGRGLAIGQMTITGVGGTSDDDAAPVLSEGGRISLSGVRIVGNHVTTTGGCVAGAVLSEGGDVSIVGCTLSDNTADGVLDGAGAVLCEGGKLDVTSTQIERNVVDAGGNVGGGMDSEGGDVTVTACDVNCNRATGTDGSDGGGGLLSVGGAVTIDNSVFTGNRASAPGDGVVADSIASDGPAPTITNTTVSDDASSCGAEPIESYFLPKNVNAKFNAADPSKSSLITAGFFDTGSQAVDLSQPATLSVGGLQFVIPALAGDGKSFTYSAAGVSFAIVPNKNGSSRAKFKLKATGDLTGKVDPSGDLTLRFTQGGVDAIGTVRLTGGRYTIGKVRGALAAPNVYMQRAKATLKGGNADSLTLFVGLATNGVTPGAASDVTIGFGSRLSVTLPAGSFTRKGDQFKFAGDQGGVTKAILDYARERITIAGKGLDLGSFAQGGNAVVVAVAVGGDQRAVAVRMARKGASMKY